MHFDFEHISVERQFPQLPPHPLSPHCFPAQLGVQEEAGGLVEELLSATQTPLVQVYPVEHFVPVPVQPEHSFVEVIAAPQFTSDAEEQEGCLVPAQVPVQPLLQVLPTQVVDAHVQLGVQ